MVHEQVIASGFYSDVFVGSTLLDMYAKCGCLDNAHDVFVKLSKANVVSWSALITGYAVHGEGLLALKSFDNMKLDGIRPDKVIFLGILKACGSIGSLEQSRQVHEEIIDCHLDLDLSLQNTLVDVYAKCGCLEEACRNFDKLSNRDAVSWGAMISGYVQHDRCAIALDCFGYMQQEGIKTDRIIFLAILKACGNIGAVEAGKQIHEQIVANSLQSDPFIGSTLVDMYAKCGSLEDACKVFNQLPNRDAVSWGVMIAGYSQHEESFIALECFHNMQQEEIEPDNITYPSILQACGSIGAMCQGRYIHSKIVEDCLHYDPFIRSALVDMYANCGSLQESWNSFSDLTIQNVVSWNAMLTGYAQVGDPTLTSECFDEMQSVGIQPDETSFCGVLNACSHAGLVDEGREYFKCMRECHGIVPNLFHYNCMIDLLGSSGYFKEAEDLLYGAVKPNMCGLMALLYACSMHANVEVGKRCFDEIVCLDPGVTQAYVLMSNIYAHVGCY